MPPSPHAIMRGQTEVGVARRVGGLELDVRVLRADRLGTRDEAQRGLAVVGAPERVRAREIARPQTDQRGHARRRHGDDAREVAQDARDECLALRRHALRAVAAGEQVAAVLEDRHVEVPAVADAVGRDERRERGAQAVRARGACGSSRARAAGRRRRRAGSFASSESSSCDQPYSAWICPMPSPFPSRSPSSSETNSLTSSIAFGL